nr:hypothetical protein [Lacrimispora sphenoides]
MVKYRKIPEERRHTIMDKEVLNYVVEKTNELISASSCSSEAKAAAQTWLDAIGTEKEAEETKKYIDELEADIMPIDGLIGFAESDAGFQVFGADISKNIAAHAKEIKSAGAKYCDCPACASAAAILDKKDILLK